ncbi:hypothetical protein [Ekhidna sp.]|uniref:hypothetical protein n=1 Tax=Ekhidna sp. TaxID=2608089 RepID=UPI0032ED4D14
MKTESKSKVVAIVSTALLLIAMFVAFEKISLSKDLSGQLNREKLKSEKALSEKMKLEKEINSFKAQLASYQGKNQNLDKDLAKMRAKLAEKEKALAKMSKNTPTAVYKNESESIKKLNQELNARIAELSSENDRLSGELSKANQLIASLNNSENDRFVDNVLSTENYRMDPMKKKNDKLTVRAKKMGRLAVSFDALSYGSDSNYRLVVKEQTGRELTGKVAVNVTETPVYYASTDKSMLLKSKKRIELKFQPEQKLKEGIYSILVYHDNDEVGSAQIRLGK